jgi:hypothetical protein
MAADDKDRIEQWLDSALRQLGDVQPRVGLEARILANVEASRRLVAGRRRWVFAVASVAVVCIALIATWRRETIQRTGSRIARVSSPIVDGPFAPPSAASLPAARKTPRRAVQPSPRSAASRSAPAHSQQFPSPLPLTERELALVKYAKSFPQDAELIAQEQQVFDQEIQDRSRELQREMQVSSHER